LLARQCSRRTTTANGRQPTGTSFDQTQRALILSRTLVAGKSTWKSRLLSGGGPAGDSFSSAAGVFDGQSQVLVLYSSGGVNERELNAAAVDHVLASEISSGSVSWYLADNLGSVRDMVQYSDSTTSVVDHVIFDSFGNATQGAGFTSDSLPEFGFQGMRVDPTTGLNITTNRQYDPTTANWISQDPAGFAAGDTNLSRFVGNSPTNAIDPSGEGPMPILLNPFPPGQLQPILNALQGLGLIKTVGTGAPALQPILNGLARLGLIKTLPFPQLPIPGGGLGPGGIIGPGGILGGGDAGDQGVNLREGQGAAAAARMRANEIAQAQPGGILAVLAKLEADDAQLAFLHGDPAGATKAAKQTAVYARLAGLTVN
jgi:RHS repeat-associated protein